jgi:hypothetical protein
MLKASQLLNMDTIQEQYNSQHRSKRGKTQGELGLGATSWLGGCEKASRWSTEALT